MSTRRFCAGERKQPIETKKAPAEARAWARRYGLGKCAECQLWHSLHADGTLVQHAARPVGRWLS